MAQGLFSELLVIDCASFIAGPAAATIMSDFGARVIKIEPPGLGDSYRALARMRGPDVMDYFWTMDSRNKESLAIDLKLPEARLVLEKLIRRADVFLTNFPFPVRERLRLRAEDVMPLNERLIYASLSPYGEQGPEKDRTAYDTTAWWARSGLMDMVKPYGDAENSFSLPGMGDHPTAMATYAARLRRRSIGALSPARAARSPPRSSPMAFGRTPARCRRRSATSTCSRVSGGSGARSARSIRPPTAARSSWPWSTRGGSGRCCCAQSGAKTCSTIHASQRRWSGSRTPAS